MSQDPSEIILIRFIDELLIMVLIIIIIIINILKLLLFFYTFCTIMNVFTVSFAIFITSLLNMDMYIKFICKNDKRHLIKELIAVHYSTHIVRIEP